MVSMKTGPTKLLIDRKPTSFFEDKKPFGFFCSSPYIIFGTFAISQTHMHETGFHTDPVIDRCPVIGQKTVGSCIRAMVGGIWYVSKP